MGHVRKKRRIWLLEARLGAQEIEITEKKKQDVTG